MDDKMILANLTDKYNLLVRKGYEVIGVFLYGSQNYGIATDKSDIDVRAIVLPSLRDFILGKELANETIVCDNNEHIEVKDIRLMHNIYVKQSVPYLEILFTKYYILNPIYSHLYQPILSNRDAIARYDEVRALKNMAYMMQARLQRMTHERPGNKDFIDECGYDYKEFVNIIREYDLMKKYARRYDFAHCLDATDKAELLSIKENPSKYSPELAEFLSTNLVEQGFNVFNNFVATNKCELNSDIPKLLNDVTYKIITTYLKQELIKKGK